MQTRHGKAFELRTKATENFIRGSARRASQNNSVDENHPVFRTECRKTEVIKVEQDTSFIVYDGVVAADPRWRTLSTSGPRKLSRYAVRQAVGLAPAWWLSKAPCQAVNLCRGIGKERSSVTHKKNTMAMMMCFSSATENHREHASVSTAAHWCHWTCGMLGLAMLMMSCAVEGPADGPASFDRGFADLPDEDFHLSRFFVSWGGTATEPFFNFVREAKPQIVQAGFYGPMFHGYADDPRSTGYPMQLPIAGQQAALSSQVETNRKLHELGVKVVGHFQMVNVIADAEKQDGFLDFYENRWDENLLGPKPHADVKELLQRNANGDPIIQKHYVDYFGLCLNSPFTRQMLKRMLDVAFDAGVDGIMSNYNYRWNCVCRYCQDAFGKWLAQHYSAAQLQQRFGIADLSTHRFEVIPGAIPGYPDTKTATPLHWEAQRFAATNFKERFDELLIEYGRSRKPDLIIATWNHLGDVGESDERAFTPIEMWGRGEHYFWYSANYPPSRLAEHYAQDGWLNCLYIRALGGGKPFMLGKYEGIRIRHGIAEGVATGGGGMGLQVPYSDPAGFEAGVSYFRFLREHDDLYHRVSIHAEVALLLPRQSILAGHPESLDSFRTLGHALNEDQVLLDVVVDQKLSSLRLSGYRAVILPNARCLSDAQCAMLRNYVRRGGVLIATEDTGADDETGAARAKPVLADLFERNKRAVLQECDPAILEESLSKATGGALSHVTAPWTLRVAAYRSPERLMLHLVNYNRDESHDAQGGAANERPIPEKHIAVSLRLPADLRQASVQSVRLLSPDAAEDKDLAWQVRDGRVSFVVPEVLVYGVVTIQLATE